MAEDGEGKARPEDAGQRSRDMTRARLSAGPIGFMLNVMTAIGGIISVIVIGGVIVLSLNGSPIPSELSNWGGIILGFYFGQMISLVKDYMGATET